jgi:hypothetical protein
MVAIPAVPDMPLDWGSPSPTVHMDAADAVTPDTQASKAPGGAATGVTAAATTAGASLARNLLSALDAEQPAAATPPAPPLKLHSALHRWEDCLGRAGRAWGGCRQAVLVARPLHYMLGPASLSPAPDHCLLPSLLLASM